MADYDVGTSTKGGGGGGDSEYTYVAGGAVAAGDLLSGNTTNPRDYDYKETTPLLMYLAPQTIKSGVELYANYELKETLKKRNRKEQRNFSKQLKEERDEYLKHARDYRRVHDEVDRTTRDYYKSFPGKDEYSDTLASKDSFLFVEAPIPGEKMLGDRKTSRSTEVSYMVDRAYEHRAAYSFDEDIKDYAEFTVRPESYHLTLNEVRRYKRKRHQREIDEENKLREEENERIKEHNKEVEEHNKKEREKEKNDENAGYGSAAGTLIGNAICGPPCGGIGGAIGGYLGYNANKVWESLSKW